MLSYSRDIINASDNIPHKIFWSQIIAYFSLLPLLSIPPPTLPSPSSFYFPFSNSSSPLPLLLLFLFIFRSSSLSLLISSPSSPPLFLLPLPYPFFFLRLTLPSPHLPSPAPPPNSNLHKVEEKVGSPERPLSDLGLITYQSYWKDALLRFLSNYDEKNVSIKSISEETAITPNDIVSTFQVCFENRAACTTASIAYGWARVVMRFK